METNPATGSGDIITGSSGGSCPRCAGEPDVHAKQFLLGCTAQGRPGLDS